VLTRDNHTFSRLMCPEWDRGLDEDTRADRAPLIRRVPYEVMIDLDMAGKEQSGSAARHRAALTLNVGHGGMLVLMDHAVHVGDPVILDVATLRQICPTASPLAEVAWTHPLPFASRTLHFVGLKFLL